MLKSDNRPYHSDEASPWMKFMCAIAIGALMGSGMAVMVACCTSSALAVGLIDWWNFGLCVCFMLSNTLC